MRPHRLRIIALAVAAVMTVPGAAVAKPASTYELTTTYSLNGFTGSVVLTIDESGATNLLFTQTAFAIVACNGGGVGTVTSLWAADGPADGTLTMTKKLDQVEWVGTAEVTTDVTSYCPDTGFDVKAATTTELFEFRGESSERLVRTRVDGDRVLTSRLDSLEMAVPGYSGVGVGHFIETISNSNKN
jgi:hypothetical protein